MEHTHSPQSLWIGRSDVARRLAWLLDESRRHDEEEQADPAEIERRERVRRVAVETVFRERQQLRRQARQRLQRTLDLAEKRALLPDHRGESLAKLGRRVRTRNLDRVTKDLFYATHHLECEELRLVAPIVEALAVMLRDAGQLEPAYALFGTTYPSWAWCNTAPSDERCTPPPRRWRHGIPLVYRADGRFRWALGVPQVEQVDWSTWAHVVGCGTRVSHAVLDALQVPRHKQIVLEVHRELSYLPGPIPRLQGRVVVVDDVHEGETSQRLARLYDADVVAVGTNGSTARLVAGLLPVLAVPEGPAVDTLNDHGRSEAGKH